MRYKKGIVGAALGALVVAAVAYCMRPESLIVDTAAVDHRPLETLVDADGRTRVRERYVVVAPVAGRLERMRHVEGAAVRAGDVVARLWPLPLDSESVMQARARSDAARSLALAADGQLQIARAGLDQRKRELSRAVRLSEVGGVAPRVVEECQLAVLEAEQGLRSADERARAADADGRQARATLDARAEGAVSVVLVRAPAAGRVLRIHERSEHIVTAGMPLMEVGDPASLEVVIDVLSSDAVMIRVGDPVRFAEWSGGSSERAASVAGRVREIEPAGFMKVSALGVEEQRVNVIADVETLPRTIGDGFRIEASIIVWSTQSALTVPRSALLQPNAGRATGTGWSVFVVRNGRVETRAIRIGHVGAGAAEVLAGLEPGDEVVLFPSDRVTPGARVSARKSAGA